MNKIQHSIDIIRNAEKIALKLSPDGFYVGFSGGKDSMVLKRLCDMAGVKYKAVMQVTTIDPPELMKFIRSHYPDVIFKRPEINFYKLIVKKKMLPTRMARYCCQYLKEQGGAGMVVMTGIRKAESSRRNKRNEAETSTKAGKNRYSNSFDQFNIDVESKFVCINGKDKIILNPIIHWTDSDVWNFIRQNEMPYCKLYDEGYHRIGCIFCPMTSVKAKQLDRQRYPGIERQIKKSLQQLIDNGQYNNFDNVNDIFDWWCSNMSFKEWNGKKGQMQLNFIKT